MVHLQYSKDERRCLETLVSLSLTGLCPLQRPSGNTANYDNAGLSPISGWRPSLLTTEARGGAPRKAGSITA